MPDQLPDPPWRVLAINTREYIFAHEGPVKRWFYTIQKLNDAGEMETMFARHNSPHYVVRAKFLRVIDHPRNDPEAMEIIANAKESGK